MALEPANAEETVDAQRENLSLRKEYLADSRNRIKLDDLIAVKVREAIKLTGDDKFPSNSHITSCQDVGAVLKAYEDAIKSLQTVTALLGRWATAEQLPTLAKLMARMSDNCARGQGGAMLNLAMR